MPRGFGFGAFSCCYPSRTNCEEFARNYEELQGIYSFSFLAEHFSERFSPKSLHVSILLHTFAIATIYMWSIPHCVEMQKTEYGGSPSTCFFALCGGSHVCCSRRGSASRFFRTLSSTVPDGFGHKATTYMICKQLHQFSAQLSCALWASARLLSKLGSKERARE